MGSSPTVCALFFLLLLAPDYYSAVPDPTSAAGTLKSAGVNIVAASISSASLLQRQLQGVVSSNIANNLEVLLSYSQFIQVPNWFWGVCCSCKYCNVHKVNLLRT